MENIQKEGKRVVWYVAIGICCTLGMILLWQILILALRPLFENEEVLVSTSQFISATIWIIPSIVLNRFLTFKDKDRKFHSRWLSFLHLFLIYVGASFFASLITFILQNSTPMELITLITDIFEPLWRMIIVIIGTGANMVCNFLGQRLLAYNS